MSTPFGAMLQPMLDQMQSQITRIGADQVRLAWLLPVFQWLVFEDFS
jgi:hypothetical protein